MRESAVAVWAGLSPFQPQVIAFVLSLCLALLTYLYRARVKLIFGRANNSFHQLKPAPDQTVSVYCEKLYVQNIGRKPAEKVEVVLQCRPSELSVYPPRTFEKNDGPDGTMILNFPFISPGELVIIDTIHINNRTAEILAVHCPDASGRRVEFWVNRKFKKSYYLFLGVMCLLGIFYSLQLAISAIVFFGR